MVMEHSWKNINADIDIYIRYNDRNMLLRMQNLSLFRIRQIEYCNLIGV